MSKPYVVSNDIRMLLSRWSESNDFVMPDDNFFKELREDFFDYMKNIFFGFEAVPEEELITDMEDILKQTSLRSVSIDRAYLPSSNYYLSITRLVNFEGEDCGLGCRYDSLPIIQQFKKLKGLKEVVLVDDVVFTGDLIERLIKILSRLKIEVPLVCAGIAIGEGIKKINRLNCEVLCVREYKEVIDEVCERDFYPAVPLSGRSLIGSNIGLPYLLPFGNPGKWASIPEKKKVDFSRFCLNQTVKLWKRIEQVSNKKVRGYNLERLLPNLSIKEGLVDYLQNLS